MHDSPGRAFAGAAMLLLVGACSGGAAPAATSESRPFVVQTAQPPPAVDLRAASIGSTTDHIVLDSEGAYFCLLRRDDDLADLRARYNPRSQG